MLQGSIKAAPPVSAASPLVRGGKSALRARHAEAGFRADALWRTAPWLAGLSIACALIVFWAVKDHTPIIPLIMWTGLVIAATWVVLRARHRATQPGTSAIARSGYWAVAEAALLAGLWGSLVLFAMGGQPVAIQLIVAGALATMMAGAFLLAMVPLAATVWAGIIAAALTIAAHSAGAEPLPLLVLMLGGYLGVILTGCLTVEAVLARQLDLVGEERASREAIGQLLREYEEQGVGWLWQIDASNLLTYVSPRICGLLGRSTSQLLGQSLPVALGCDSRLGGALVAREPFNGLEIEVPATGGARVVSLTGNPVIGPDGAFHGFRGVGVDVTERARIAFDQRAVAALSRAA